MALLALLCLLTAATLVWASRMGLRVRAQTAALERAQETARAIGDLSQAMQTVSDQQRFDAAVSVRGSEEIAQLVVGFNRMIEDLREGDRARRKPRPS